MILLIIIYSLSLLLIGAGFAMIVTIDHYERKELEELNDLPEGDLWCDGEKWVWKSKKKKEGK